MTIIEFQIQLKINTKITIQGCMNLKDADGENPLLYYDDTGNLQDRVPKNPYDYNSDEYTDYEILKNTFENDDLFIQWLVDFAEEQKTVDRGDYILRINGGDDL